MLHDAVDESKNAKRHVDHSTAGSQYAVKTFGPQYGKILAYIISGHHAGIPDGKSTSLSCLEKRLSSIAPTLQISNPDFSLLPFQQEAVKLYRLSILLLNMH